MKIFTKLILSFVLILSVILIADGYISFQRQVKLFETNIKKDMDIIGLTMKSVIEDTWQKNGEQQTFKIINDLTSEASHIKIRFVWLDVPSGDTNGPKISKEKLKSVIQGHFVLFKDQEKNFMYCYFPILVDKLRPAALELSESLSYTDAYARSCKAHCINRNTVDNCRNLFKPDGYQNPGTAHETIG